MMRKSSAGQGSYSPAAHPNRLLRLIRGEVSSLSDMPLGSALAHSLDTDKHPQRPRGQRLKPHGGIECPASFRQLGAAILNHIKENRLPPDRLPIGLTAARPSCRWSGRSTPVGCATSCDRYRTPAGRWWTPRPTRTSCKTPSPHWRSLVFWQTAQKIAPVSAVAHLRCPA